MTAASHDMVGDWKIEQGATWGWSAKWTVDGTDVDLSAYTARMSLKARPGANAEITLTTENGRIILNEVAGRVRLVLTAAETAALRPGNYLYDIELISSGGIVTRWIEGVVEVYREITTES